MITVKVREHGICMCGHAGCREDTGVDRACAAVSALTCNLINSLRDLTGDEIFSETRSGFSTISWENLTENGKLLVDSWYLGMSDINNEYNCIEFQ